MIELVVYIILINVIFEFLKIVCPMSKLSGFVRSVLSLIMIYLICLKIKTLI